MSDSEKYKRRSKRRQFFVILTFVGVLLVGVFVFRDVPQSIVQSRLNAAAAEVAIPHVRDRLRCPLDATFPEEQNVHYDAKSEIYTVMSLVKAKNATGAELTLPWKVTLQYEGSKRWKLVDVTMNESDETKDFLAE
ncbi:MAG: hypothetical protein JXM70_01840 [Pirellulales bacterium]|nr:hypothetical protein [Pirellulales bacterium]